MKRISLLSVAGILAFSLAAMAQEPDEGDVFGGAPPEFGGMSPEELAALPTKIIVYTNYSDKEEAMNGLLGLLDSQNFSVESSSATKVTAYSGKGPGGMPGGNPPQGAPSGMSGGMPSGGMGGPGGGMGGGMRGGMGGPGGGMGGPGMGGGMPGGGMGGPGMGSSQPSMKDNRPFLKAKVAAKKGQVVITMQTNKTSKSSEFTAKINLPQVAGFFPGSSYEVLK